MAVKSRKYDGILRNLAVAFLCVLALSVGMGMKVYAYENTVGVINEGGARIRSSASTDSSVLASVVSGDKVEICGEETASDGYTWYKVYVNGKTIGYIRADLVTNTGEKTGGVTDNNVTGNAGNNGDSQNTGDDSGTENLPDGDDGEQPDDGSVQDPEMNQDDAASVPVVNDEVGLSGLSISNGTLIPSFSPEITEYTISVDESTTSIAVYGVPNGEGAEVVENYGFSDLQKGSNMAVITVRGADGSTKSYYFTVNRGDASSEIHYSDPVTVGDSSVDEKNDESGQQKRGGSTGVIIFLIIIILAMAAVMVLMGLRIRDYRRELYGEDPEEFHLRDAIPENSVFRKTAGARTGSTREGNTGTGVTRAGSTRTGVTRTGRTRTEDARTGITGADGYEKRDSAPEKEDVSGMYDSTLNGDTIEDEPVVSQNFESVEDGFLYDMKKIPEDAAQIQDPGMLYQKTEEPDFDEDEEENVAGIEIDPEDDELEDIMERNATITDQENGKEVWKSVNFMTPADDLEFEFLDLEDENE